MTDYLLDTNHLAAMLDDQPLREQVHRVRRQGSRVAVCVPVLCELQVGLHHTKRRDRNIRVLSELLKQIRIRPLTLSIARIYADIFHELRARGRVLSQVDMMLAALARLEGMCLVTSDRDFDALPDIRTENWLTKASRSGDAAASLE